MNENIPENEKEVLNLLPSTRKKIANKLNISRRVVRYRMKKLEEEEGYVFECNEDYEWSIKTDAIDQEEDNDLDNYNQDNDHEEPQRMKSYNKAQATKDINDSLVEIEKDIKNILNKSREEYDDSKEYETSSFSSTLVLPHSDAHIGANILSREGADYYDSTKAGEAIDEYFYRAIEAAEERDDVEEVAIILNGDLLDGEGIYPSQRHGQEDNLKRQIRKASGIYIENILRLSKEFPFVSVYCIPGNHGRINRKSTTNADDILYDFIETGIIYSEADNVLIEKAGPGGFLNFEIRGWKVHARHGENYLEHIGTSSGKKRAYAWQHQYDFDLGIRSHYHKMDFSTIGDNVPIIMTGSPAPPSTFAESRSESGGKCGVFFFTTEENVVEDFQPVYL